MLRLLIKSSSRRTRDVLLWNRRTLTTSDIEEHIRLAAEGKLSHKTGAHIPLEVSRTKHVASLTHEQRGPLKGDVDRRIDDYLDVDDDDSDGSLLGGGFGYLTGGTAGGGGGGGPPGTGVEGSSVPLDPIQEKEAQERELKRKYLEKYHEKDHLHYWLESDYDPVDEMAVEEQEKEMEIPPPAPAAATVASVTENALEELMVVGGDVPIDDPEVLEEEEEDDDLANEDELDGLTRQNELEVVAASDWDRNNDILTMLSDDNYWKRYEQYTPEQIEARNRKFNTIKQGIECITDVNPQTRFEAETFDNPHPNMLREPKPFFPKQRLQPPQTFIDTYQRFLFVTGLPPMQIEGKLVNVKGATHQAMVRRAIVEALGNDIESIQVFATDPCSGFVGFENEVEVGKRLLKEPKQATLSHRMTLSPVDDSNGFGAPGTVLKLDHIPRSQHTPKTILRELFPPKESNEGAAFESITMDDIKFLSAGTALIRFETVEQALNASNSPYVKKQLDRLSQYPLKIFRARRELVHKEYGAYPLHDEIRQLGKRLLVDSDIPTKPFYTSHAGVIHVSNLDPAASIYEISHVFQPFCAIPRDEIGSIEFVRCERGHATGEAFIGFDLPGDAEAALKGLPQSPLIGDRKVYMRLVQERKYPLQKTAPLERRPDRSVEELDRDLNNWEQHVDPKEVQTLLDAGIRKEVLDDALRAMRQGNPLFGPLDAGMRSESLEPEKSTGQQWRDMVRLYISTLIECLVTPDNPDSMPPLYEALHFPGEEIDMGIFEQERKRLEAQAQFRSKF